MTDDPWFNAEQSPVGEVRQHPTIPGAVAICVEDAGGLEHRWCLIQPGSWSRKVFDSYVAEWPVVGVVPGTPSAAIA